MDGEDETAQTLLCIPGHTVLEEKVKDFDNWEEYFSEGDFAEPFVEGRNVAPDDGPVKTEEELAAEGFEGAASVKVKRRKKADKQPEEES